MHTSRTENFLGRYYLKNAKGLDQYYVQFLTTPGLFLKTRCLVYMLLPSADYLREVYGVGKPSGAVWLYVRYYTDSMRMVFRYAKSLLQR
jgi:hypothetical protein